jgi:hypothetical protein
VNIHIFDLAQDDLAAGFQFYENQHSGLGEYFLNSLSADNKVAPNLCRNSFEVWRLLPFTGKTLSVCYLL